MRAYLIMKVKPPETAQLMQDLKGYEHVTQAAVIHGPFDCIAELVAPSLETINDTVLAIRTHSGVVDTMTCLIVQSWQRDV